MDAPFGPFHAQMHLREYIRENSYPLFPVGKVTQTHKTQLVMTLLSINNDAKTKKGLSKSYITGIQYLAPLKIGERDNVCPNASAGCAKACLYTAGRGAFNSVQMARIKRTKFFFDDREAYKAQLVKEMRALCAKASKQGLSVAVRLNGTSDIAWEKVLPEVFVDFPSVQFYDYTKSVVRMHRFLQGELPANYYLTFSRSENNDRDAADILRAGGNVAIVFRRLPDFERLLLNSSGQTVFQKTKDGLLYFGHPVLSGDQTDLRFLDANNRGHWIALAAKGKAKRINSGFVVPGA